MKSLILAVCLFASGCASATAASGVNKESHYYPEALPPGAVLVSPGIARRVEVKGDAILTIEYWWSPQHGWVARSLDIQAGPRP